MDFYSGAPKYLGKLEMVRGNFQKFNLVFLCYLTRKILWLILLISHNNFFFKNGVNINNITCLCFLSEHIT